MHQEKLSQVFHALSGREKAALGKYLTSPIMNKHNAVISLFQYLKTIPAGQVINRKDAFGFMFPGVPFEGTKFIKIASLLNQKIEAFLGMIEYKKEGNSERLFSLKGLRRKGLPKSINGILIAATKALAKQKSRDSDYHLARFQLLQSRFYSEAPRSMGAYESLQSMSDQLDVFFCAEKLKEACSIMTHERMFKVKYSPGFVQEVIAHVEQNGMVEIPAIGIYYSVYQTMISGEPEVHFQRLKKQLSEWPDKFPQDEIRSLYMHAINFCVKRINTGNKEYIQEVFQIYKQSLENQVLFERGVLSPWAYRNIVSAGIRSNEFQWVESFIHEYKTYLPQEEAMYFHAFNLARLHMARAEFQKIPGLLLGIYTRDTFHELDSRVMLIQAYYELDEFQMIEYQLENFKKVLQRKEVLMYHQKNYNNFRRYFLKLIKIAPGNQTALKLLLEKVENEPQIINKDWLLEKIIATPTHSSN